MKYWLIKCRKELPDSREGWHWNLYFDNPKGWRDRAARWGGAKWIRSRQSCKYIREVVRKGDIIVCYQTDGRLICGLTRMADRGIDDPKSSGHFNTLKISPVSDAFRFEPPVTVGQLREAGCNPKWLTKGQGTVFPLSANEFSGLVGAVSHYLPHAAENLTVWVRWFAGMNSPKGGTIHAALLKKLGGAGIRADPRWNKDVEEAAIRAVTESFERRGWTFTSVECEQCGYDLECRKGSQRRDVEVKGVTGIETSFPITRNELGQAKSNSRFRLWVVTEALSARQKLHQWTVEEFRAKFDLNPLAYMATRRLPA